MDQIDLLLSIILMKFVLINIESDWQRRRHHWLYEALINSCYFYLS